MKPDIEMIDTLRKGRGWTLQQFAEQLGITGENKRQCALAAMRSMKQLPKIAKLFGVEEFNLLSQDKKSNGKRKN
jgi:transcriptional regulator with XRE-family HTH domain